MRALITGAKGQLGRYLVPLLSGRGYEIECGPWDGYTVRPDEVYVLHQIRYEVETGYHEYMLNGPAEAAAILEEFGPKTRIIFCGSIKQDDGTSPWHLSRQFVSKLVEQFPNAMIPRLPQFVSKHVNPKRQYTGQILHELAKGIEPTPINPESMLEVTHARDVALYLACAVKLPIMQMSLATYISLAKTPGTWLNQIVEEIREGSRL